MMVQLRSDALTGRPVNFVQDSVSRVFRSRCYLFVKCMGALALAATAQLVSSIYV